MYNTTMEITIFLWVEMKRNTTVCVADDIVINIFNPGALLFYCIIMMRYRALLQNLRLCTQLRKGAYYTAVLQRGH